MNSLYVLLAFMAFLAFGYVTQVRIIHKFARALGSHEQASFELWRDGQTILKQLGQSVIFVSLPSLSLLLFWGWGPALLWLFIFHLLFETVINFQLAGNDSIAKVELLGHRSNLHKHRSGSSSDLNAWVVGIAQLFAILCSAISVCLLAELVDEQIGLVFVIAGVLAFLKILRNSSSSVPTLIKVSGAFFILLLAIIFTRQLGFSVYGNWAPFDSIMPWLSFNNTTLIALALILTSINYMNDEVLTDDLSLITGGLIILMFCAILFSIGWAQPLLDAPLHSSQDRPDSLPTFGGLSLFIGAAMVGLVFRIYRVEESQDKLENSAKELPIMKSSKGVTRHSVPEAEHRFETLQTESAVHLLFSVALCLGLAAALGIGAWKTHYLEWGIETLIGSHFDLAVASLQNALAINPQNTSLSHSMFISGVSLAGITFLLLILKFMCQGYQGLFVIKSYKDETFAYVAGKSGLAHGVIIFFVACYFIANGISVNDWLLLVMLAWFLVSDHLLKQAELNSNSDLLSTWFAIMSLSLAAIGMVQLIWRLISAVAIGHYGFSLMCLILLIVASVQWWQVIMSICQRFSKPPQDPKLFD